MALDQSLSPEVALLAALSETLEKEYLGQDDLLWEKSPFGWLKTRPSRQVGTIGERLVAGWLASHEFNVLRSPDSDADRVIESLRTEIKFSTLWRGGFYKFQQIRDQNYDMLVCLGVSPFNAHCWAMTKEEVMDRWGCPDGEGLPHQHGGRAGTDTCWLTVDPKSPYAWLNPHGGSLADGLRSVASLSGRPLT